MGKTMSLTVILATLALFALLSLQYIWIRQSYKQENERVRLTALQIIKRETQFEVHKSSYSFKLEDGLFRFYGGSIEEKTVYIITQKNGKEIERKVRQCLTIEEWYEYIQNMYVMYHNNGIDLNRLDSSFTAALSTNKISIPHKLELVDRINNTVKESTNADSFDDYKLIIDTIPLGIDDKDALVVKFDNSFAGMFTQFKNIIYVSVAIVIVLLFILTYLARTVSTQIKLSIAREEFVNFMIHEIRNPVSHLSHILEMCGMGMDIRKYMPKANNNIEILKLMLEKLQTVSIGKRLAIKPEKINIREELKKISEIYSDEKTSVIVEANTELDTIVVDKLHFTNAIRNLVENASKYRKGDNVNIVISYLEENGKFNVSVKDNGIGIPQFYTDMIFDKGYRIPANKSVKRLGFGLGLTYVKMVATAHNGEVSVRSKYKEGSTFTISI